MIAAIVAIAVDVLGEAIAYAGTHPEVAIGLVRTVREALGEAKSIDDSAGKDGSIQSADVRIARLTGLASGLAAARANAVQEIRRKLQDPKLRATVIADIQAALTAPPERSRLVTRASKRKTPRKANR